MKRQAEETRARQRAAREARNAAAATGMVSPARQGRIQIEITNSCGGHRHAGKCSNCSRFCPHVAKPFFMDLATFCRAVDSMRGYGGMLGIMGGEPTLHPEFAALVEYFRANWHPGQPHAAGRQPIEDFGAYYRANLTAMHGRKRGLWTSLGPGYARHFELIQETFPYQCINTHRNGARHQAILVTRRELGIADAEWIKLRDRCWVQRLWSASITPKGCFPCEIMAALDMLYEGPGGWPIEPGWWRRTPEQFGDMLPWCELCGMPLATPARPATDEIQDVSPEHSRRLAQVGSPAVAAGRVRVIDPAAVAPAAAKGPGHASGDWYMPAEDKPRRAAGEACLRLGRIDGIVVSVDCGDQLARTLPRNLRHLDRLVVVTASHDALSQRIARDHGAELVISDACYQYGDAFNKGRMLNAALEAAEATDWLLLHDADVFLPADLGQELRRLILNPGCLYYTRRHHLPGDAQEPDWTLRTEDHRLDPAGNHGPWGYFQLMNVRARCLLPERGLRFPTCFCSAGAIDHWTMTRWPKEKRISLSDWAGDTRFDVLHLWHGPLGGRWNGPRQAKGVWRFAGQSGGGSEEMIARQWPVPCRVRRIDVATLDMEEMEWTGDLPAPAWRKPAIRGTAYEYSVKEEEA